MDPATADKREKFKEKRSLSFGSLKSSSKDTIPQNLVTVKNPVWMTTPHDNKKKHKKTATKEKEKKEKKEKHGAEAAILQDRKASHPTSTTQLEKHEPVRKLDLHLSDPTPDGPPTDHSSTHQSQQSERSTDRSDRTDDSKRASKRRESPRVQPARREGTGLLQLPRDSSDGAKKPPSDRDRIHRDASVSSSGTTPRSGTGSPSPRLAAPTGSLTVSLSAPLSSDPLTGNGSEVRRRNPLFQMNPAVTAKLSPSAAERQNSASVGEKVVRNPIWRPRAALMQLLKMHRFTVLGALSDVVQPKQYEDFGKHIFFLFEPRKDLLPRLMRWALRREVSLVAVDQLFRVLDPPTKLLSLYLRRHGGSYLRASLRTFLAALDENSGSLSWELDPAKISAHESPIANAERLCTVTKNLLDELHRWTDKVSPGVRMLFRYARTQFPAFERTVFGALFFLRFVCPAVAAPDSFQLLDAPPSKEMRRRLVLVSKLLQNLANDVLFGDKEPYMVPLNQFLVANKNTVASLLTRLVKPNYKARRKSMQPAPSLLLLDEADFQQEDPVEYIKQQIHLHRDRALKRIPKQLPACYERFSQYCNTLRGMEPRRVLVDGASSSVTDDGSSISGRERDGSSAADSSGSMHRSASVDELALLTREIKAKLRSWARGNEEALEVELKALEQRLEQEIRVRHGLERQVQMLRSQLDVEQKARKELVSRLQKYEPAASALVANSGPASSAPSPTPHWPLSESPHTPSSSSQAGISSSRSSPESPPDRPIVLRPSAGTPRNTESSNIAHSSRPRPVRWTSMASLRKRNMTKTTSVSFDQPPQLPVPVLVRAADAAPALPSAGAEGRRMSFG